MQPTDILGVVTAVLLKITTVTEHTHTSIAVWYAQSRAVQLHRNIATGSAITRYLH